MKPETHATVGLNVYSDAKQGDRDYMEDIISFAKHATVGSGGDFVDELESDVPFASFFIFDGHGGVQAARFAEQHLLKQISKQDGFHSDDDEVVIKAIKEGFLKTQHLMEEEAHKWPTTCQGYSSTSGTTVSMVLIRKGKMYVANVGDSTVVLGEQNDDKENRWTSNVLTNDHKPDSSEELERIRRDGGEVMTKTGVARVVWKRKRIKFANKNEPSYDRVPFLAVARSLGDLWSYNKELNVYTVSPEPDVTVHKLDVSRIKCIVLASDGLWNVFTPSNVINLIHTFDKTRQDCPEKREDIALELVETAFMLCNAKNVKSDNISIIVIFPQEETGTDSSKDSKWSLSINVLSRPFSMSFNKMPSTLGSTNSATKLPNISHFSSTKASRSPSDFRNSECSSDDIDRSCIEEIEKHSNKLDSKTLSESDSSNTNLNPENNKLSNSNNSPLYAVCRNNPECVEKELESLNSESSSVSLSAFSSLTSEDDRCTTLEESDGGLNLLIPDESTIFTCGNEDDIEKSELFSNVSTFSKSHNNEKTSGIEVCSEGAFNNKTSNEVGISLKSNSSLGNTCSDLNVNLTSTSFQSLHLDSTDRNEDLKSCNVQLLKRKSEPCKSIENGAKRARCSSKESHSLSDSLPDSCDSKMCAKSLRVCS